ncbi:MAG TPA: adenosylmethionine--8-amino-7-oxononanoate transaminase [Symbiobacteriaceae bacterium]
MAARTQYDPATLVALDKAHVWHPFTYMKDYVESDPVIIARGEGVRLQDIHGRWYYDGVSSIWLNVHGHRVPAIDRAIIAQLGEIAHSTLLGQANVPSILLADRLVRIAPPGLTRVFYSDSGATAVEIALKMAIQYWANLGEPRRRRILGFSHNYHGDTLGAMAVAPDEIFHWPFLGLLPEHPRAPYPYCYRCPLEKAHPGCQMACLAVVEETVARHRDELAAVIIEPVEGAGGIIPAPPGYLRAIRELCDRYNLLLIVDEVATGFGRTGTLFACEQEGITPDILTLGKGLTGGYLPVAATLTTERIYTAFLGERRHALYHGHSYTGNQLGCAAALANLDLIEETGLIASLPPKIEQVAAALAPLRDHPYVGDVRQKGLMVGIELVADRKTRRPFPWEAQAGYRVAWKVRERGMLIRPIGSVVIFMPPLASTREELGEMLQILLAGFDAATEELAKLAGGEG